jgi:hypothetical protein
MLPRSVFALFLIPVAAAGVFLLAGSERTLTVSRNNPNNPDLPRLPESEPPTESLAGVVLGADGLPARAGAPKQKPLPDPPAAARAVYLTGWTAGSGARLESLVDLVDRDERLNAMVIDIKDYSGRVSYRTEVPEAKASGAESELRIADMNGVIKRLHDKNIYVIGRITVFQDPILAKYRPEWAVQSASGGVWRDRKGLSWLDAGAKPVWDYNIALAKDALERGFDEVNFDYIRFPSDGDLAAAVYPFSGPNPPRREIIRGFFKYLRENLPGAKISADIFGLTTVAEDDLGIGQMIEDAYAYFDYVAPMVYPSHYASGFNGYKNPAAHPYEVVKHSLEGALLRRQALANSTSTAGAAGKLRPWLQVFDLGAVYDKDMVEAQIRAVEEALNNAAGSGAGAGWMLWDPKNVYQGYIR